MGWLARVKTIAVIGVVGTVLAFGARRWVSIRRFVPGAWHQAGQLNEARESHAATLLSDGRVLVTGGRGKHEALASAEVFDPTTARWTLTRPMHAPRIDHAAVRLRDGRVVVAGGSTTAVHKPTALATAEVWDPKSGAWTETGTLAAGRRSLSASVLPDGRVLVAGGLDARGFALPSAEVWDPATGRWSRSGELSAARYGHKATVLEGGKVAVVGGRLQGPDPHPARGEIWDPASGSWSLTDPLPKSQHATRTRPLADGSFLLIEAAPTFGEDMPVKADVWHPATGDTRRCESLPKGRHGASFTELTDGRVFITGGANTVYESPTLAERMVDGPPARTVVPVFHGRVDVFDPASRRWFLAEDLEIPRMDHSATPLPDGRVLIAGGESDRGVLESAEIWSPER